MLVEESLIGWDEFELELMRDRNDNVVVVCSIENLDPMGVHTGDSVTVAPQMTLSDEAYQELRDAGAAVIREVGVETGGANIQFARHRETGELRVIELNPRVSRSSALASKATGYPIAKVAAKLAVGYTLDEIPNDLTGRRRRASSRRSITSSSSSALRVREVPRGRPNAGDADEVRRRGDGHRALLRGGVPEGEARARSTTPGSRAICTRGSRPSSTRREVLAGVTDVDQLVADDWVRVKRAGWSIWTSRRAAGRPRRRSGRSGARPEFGLYFGVSTPVPARSRPLRPTTTRPGAKQTRLLRKGTVHGS